MNDNHHAREKNQKMNAELEQLVKKRKLPKMRQKLQGLKKKSVY